MGKPILLMQVEKCPVCHSKETVARKAVELANVEIPTGGVAITDRSIVPLRQPMLAAVAVPSLVIDYDVCIKCGTKYTVRSQIEDIPLQVQGVPRR